MEKIKLQVSGSQIQVVERPAAITAGTVGLEAEFSFDSHWENLGKTVIFRAGDKVITAAYKGMPILCLGKSWKNRICG